MRLSFPLRVFLLLGLWTFTGCAQANAPTAALPPTANSTATGTASGAATAPEGDKTLRFVEFFSPM